MRRREFIALVCSAGLASPLAAWAQATGTVYRVGFLWDSPAVFAEAIETFRSELREMGWIEGRNIAIEYRWAEGQPERMRELAEELVRLKVDIIVVPSSIYTEAAKRATSTIPIIFMSHAGPLESGHVISLARPGGNITGISVMLPETSVKGMQLLKEFVPGSRALRLSGTRSPLRTSQACVLFKRPLLLWVFSFKLCRYLPRRTMTPPSPQ
jgi:putative tryptophan/tyrosine transport system substrate-binding protein